MAKGSGSSKNCRKSASQPEAQVVGNALPQEGFLNPVAEESQGDEGMFLLSDKEAWPSLESMKRSVLEPLQLVQREWRQELAPMFAVFAFALMLYGITAPRYVTLEDDGLFLMNLHHFGVAHPPGYPLYTLLGGPFYHLLPDFLLPAYKGHMFSGFAAAISCVALYAVVTMLVRSRVCALAAGMAYAASEAFWSQAIIAEVYSLNAMVYFILLALCIKYASHSGTATMRHRWLYCLIAMVYGLGLSNHWPLIGLGSLGLLLVVVSQWRTLLRRIPLGGVALLCGLLPYVWLVVRSRMEHPINFYGEVEDLKGLWFYVTRGGYAGVDKQAGVGWEEKWAFIKFFTGELGRQITWAGLLVAVMGVVAMLRSKMHSWLAVALCVAWIMTGPLMIYLLDFQAEFIWFSAFRVYHLLCYGITVIFFGYGLAWLGEYLRPKMPKMFSVQGAVGVTGALVVSASVLAHWNQNNRSDYTWAHELALFKLLAVEPNTRLFIFDDLDLPVGYLNYVENIRPDVKVYNDQGLVFGNRIYSPFSSDEQKKRVITKFIQKQEPYPVYYHSNREALFVSRNYGSDFLGVWRRVNRDSATDRVVLTEGLRLWLENNLDVSKITVDRWTKQQAAGVVATLISAVHQATLNGYVLTPEWEDAISKATEKNALVHLFLLWDAVRSYRLTLDGAREEVDWINSLFTRDEELIFDNNNWADALLLKAQILAQFPEVATGDLHAQIEQTLRLSLGYEFKFLVFQFLTDYLRSKDRGEEAIALLKEQYPLVSNAPNNFRELHSQILKEQLTGKRLRPLITLPEVVQ